ncbi:MAG: glycoside hydrolase family 3 protein [Mongoliitalea sp.]
MHLLEKIGQLFTPAAYIHDTEENIQAMERLIQTHGIGGITFFHSRHSAAANFEQRQEKLSYEYTLEKLIALINRYQSVSKIPLLISIDAEFGLAMRIEDTPHYPFAIAMGALSLDKLAWLKEYGERMGRDLKACGIHLNFAPVADINTNANNPVIGYRSFGADREKVSAFALATYQGMKKAGITACYKHFPGHGDTAVDSHLGLPVIHKSKEELKREELLPFADGIQAGVEMIMVGHLAVPALTQGKNTPATISKEIITGLLRGEMGFDGIIVSDALNMKAVADMFSEPGRLELEAFAAGTDLLCFSENIAEGIQLIAKHGDVDQIERSFQRIQSLKQSLGITKEETVTVPNFEFDTIRQFNKTLAGSYTQLIHQRDELGRQLANVGLSIGSPKINRFVSGANFPVYKSVEVLIPKLNKESIIAVALFVPSAKPVNHFGLDLSALEHLSQLGETYPVDLYVFGNPLAIPHIRAWENFRSITVAYHDFEVNQEIILEKLEG